MAETQASFGYAAAPAIYEETALGATKQQAKVGAFNTYGIDIDNQSNAIVYVKAYFKAAGDVIVGTTAPDEIYPVPTLTRIHETVVSAVDVQMPTGLTLAAVTTPGTPGTTPPAAGNVGVRVVIE